MEYNAFLFFFSWKKTSYDFRSFLSIIKIESNHSFDFFTQNNIFAVKKCTTQNEEKNKSNTSQLKFKDIENINYSEKKVPNDTKIHIKRKKRTHYISIR